CLPRPTQTAAHPPNRRHILAPLDEIIPQIGPGLALALGARHTDIGHFLHPPPRCQGAAQQIDAIFAIIAAQAQLSSEEHTSELHDALPILLPTPNADGGAPAKSSPHTCAP